MPRPHRSRIIERCCRAHCHDCQPPLNLCCDRCTEGHHVSLPGASGMGYHDDQSRCVREKLCPSPEMLLDFQPGSRGRRAGRVPH